MKKLLILRHAKAAFESATGEDVDRPLAESGKQQAQKLGFKLKGRNLKLDAAWVSQALRTQQTSFFLFTTAGIDLEIEEKVNWLYQADYHEVIKRLTEASNDLQTILIIGHNPTMTQVVNHLIEVLQLDNLPTCGLIEIGFAVSKWEDISPSKAELIWHDFPKVENSFL